MIRQEEQFLSGNACTMVIRDPTPVVHMHAWYSPCYLEYTTHSMPPHANGPTISYAFTPTYISNSYYNSWCICKSTKNLIMACIRIHSYSPSLTFILNRRSISKVKSSGFSWTRLGEIDLRTRIKTALIKRWLVPLLLWRPDYNHD